MREELVLRTKEQSTGNPQCRRTLSHRLGKNTRLRDSSGHRKGGKYIRPSHETKKRKEQVKLESTEGCDFSELTYSYRENHNREEFKNIKEIASFVSNSSVNHWYTLQQYSNNIRNDHSEDECSRCCRVLSVVHLSTFVFLSVQKFVDLDLPLVNICPPLRRRWFNMFQCSVGNLIPVVSSNCTT